MGKGRRQVLFHAGGLMVISEPFLMKVEKEQVRPSLTNIRTVHIHVEYTDGTLESLRFHMICRDDSQILLSAYAVMMAKEFDPDKMQRSEIAHIKRLGDVSQKPDGLDRITLLDGSDNQWEVMQISSLTRIDPMKEGVWIPRKHNIERFLRWFAQEKLKGFNSGD